MDAVVVDLVGVVGKAGYQSTENRVAKIRPAVFTVRDKGASLFRVPGCITNMSGFDFR